MKALRNILEGLLRGQQSTLASGGEAIYVLIEEFLKENYKGEWTISEEPNEDGLYVVNSNDNVYIKNKQMTSLVNDLFVWGTINGGFDCSWCSLTSLKGAPKTVKDFVCCECPLLESLEGGPEIVTGYFDCGGCKSLKTLEGGPQEVRGTFYCNHCKSLTSLKGAPGIIDEFNCSGCDSLKTLIGAPEIVESYFDCSNCKSLKNLKGAPKIVKGSFDCNTCKSLKSLEGAPKTVKRDFYCQNCGFTKDDVNKVSKVKGSIFC